MLSSHSTVAVSSTSGSLTQTETQSKPEPKPKLEAEVICVSPLEFLSLKYARFHRLASVCLFACLLACLALSLPNSSNFPLRQLVTNFKVKSDIVHKLQPCEHLMTEYAAQKFFNLSLNNLWSSSVAYSLQTARISTLLKLTAN